MENEVECLENCIYTRRQELFADTLLKMTGKEIKRTNNPKLFGVVLGCKVNRKAMIRN